MELKLKDDNEVKKEESTSYDSGVKPNGGYGLFIDSPVVISTVVDKPVTAKKSSDFDLMGIIKWIVIALIVVVGVKLFVNLVNPKATDVTAYVNMETADVEAELDVTLPLAPDMAGKINQWSNNRVVTVNSDGEIGVVYMDGKHIGLHIADKKYTMFGVKIGDGETTIDNNITFDYENSMFVLNDMAEGKSTATYYYNKTNNDCLVVIINDNSNRVVAMTYFNNYAKVTETLSGLDE